MFVDLIVRPAISSKVSNSQSSKVGGGKSFFSEAVELDFTGTSFLHCLNTTNGECASLKPASDRERDSDERG